MQTEEGSLPLGGGRSIGVFAKKRGLGGGGGGGGDGRA